MMAENVQCTIWYRVTLSPTGVLKYLCERGTERLGEARRWHVARLKKQLELEAEELRNAGSG